MDLKGLKTMIEGLSDCFHLELIENTLVITEDKNKIYEKNTKEKPPHYEVKMLIKEGVCSNMPYWSVEKVYE
jgi:hypothetical protein